MSIALHVQQFDCLIASEMYVELQDRQEILSETPNLEDIRLRHDSLSRSQAVNKIMRSDKISWSRFIVAQQQCARDGSACRPSPAPTSN